MVTDHFWSTLTFSTLANQLPPLVVASAGLTLVLIAGGIPLVLAQDGKLSLDDDVRNWLPELPEYSNSGYTLLAHALECVGGKLLGEMARERIFEPLGMEGSLMYENREEIIPRRATGYHHDDDRRLRIVHNYNFEIAGDGHLTVRIEQQPPLPVAPVAEDAFRVEFESREWAAYPARLEFRRNVSGAVTWLSLSSGSERGLVFERQPGLDA